MNINESSINKWKVVKTRTLFDDPRFPIIEDEVELPNGRRTTYISQAPTSDHSVIILVINEANELLVQQEYSHPPAEIMWQLPGGAMETGETPISAAQRELAEESGLNMIDPQILGFFYVNNRKSNRKQHIIYSNQTVPTKAKPDDDEFISTHWIPLGEVNQMIADGKITNINMLATLRVWSAKFKH